jgi:hypothetical protein
MNCIYRAADRKQGLDFVSTVLTLRYMKGGNSMSSLVISAPCKARINLVSASNHSLCNLIFMPWDNLCTPFPPYDQLKFCHVATCVYRVSQWPLDILQCWHHVVLYDGISDEKILALLSCQRINIYCILIAT